MDAPLGLPALVKINLTLHVGAVRGDGYHPVSTLCVFAAAGDRVTLGALADDFALTVTGPEAGALADLDAERNLVLRAARRLAAATEVRRRRLRLDKRVPAAGGIAGGTADAAAALVLLNRTSARPLPDAALIALARDLGADGPVCVAARLAGGGVWHAEGDGDQVGRVGAAPAASVLLVNPREAMPTPAVFARFDETEAARPLDQPATALRTLADLVAAARAGRNDLRAPAISLLPCIAEVEDLVARAPGCRFARMSGSGATVFGLFADARSAARAARGASARGWWAAAAPLARG